MRAPACSEISSHADRAGPRVAWLACGLASPVLPQRISPGRLLRAAGESLFGNLVRRGMRWTHDARSVSQVITAPPCAPFHSRSVMATASALVRPADAGERLRPGAQRRGAQLQPAVGPVADPGSPEPARRPRRPGPPPGWPVRSSAERRDRTAVVAAVRWWLFFLGCWFFS